MAKKKNNKNNKSNSQAQKNVKPVELQPVTKETVAGSATITEFEQNKDKYITSFLEDLEALENNKKELEANVEELRDKIKELKETEESVKYEAEGYQELLNSIKADYEKANATIESAKVECESLLNKAQKDADATIESAKVESESLLSNAKEDADVLRKNAEREKLGILVDASEKARNAYKTEIEKLESQLDDIAEREKKLNESKIELDRSQRKLEMQQAEINEMADFNLKLKEKYKKYNPGEIEKLEIELDDEKIRYQALLDQYNEIRGKLKETQVLFDTIKGEIEEENGNKRISSLNEIVDSMQDFKRKYEDLASIYDRYPDNMAITKLEEKALRVEVLENENNALEQERDRYRAEVVAARSASKELEVIKHEVEATNALNEHLLQELESHKTALESRTGDTCPSLTKVDAEVEDKTFIDEIANLAKYQKINSLADLVEHIRNYAGSRKKEEQLFYTRDDIRAFISGMAVSRLIILQGMSGTGKSSLPRIIADSISGFNRLIPVESSWRDRNELLGYYNDFNKKFNAKTFTIELYRSAKERCQEIPTFIVLDEMNLARVEYYFSDFLAILQEPDHDKWLIELVSSDMRTLPMELPEDVKEKMSSENPSIYSIWQKIERSRQGDLKATTSDDEKEQLTAYLGRIGKLTGAKDLIDGRKIKVTDNIWFIGTANQDESTFEISDKVYDRAQVVSLNRKGKNESDYKKDTKKRSVSVDDLQKMFSDAIEDFSGEDEVISRLNKLDDVLVENFDVSFGNRIVNQTIDFAAVFTAAGGDIKTAIDYQISSKILRKVISSDDADAFLELLDVTNEYQETQRLINKRIKELG